jgi:hypothetical protein
MLIDVLPPLLGVLGAGLDTERSQQVSCRLVGVPCEDRVQTVIDQMWKTTLTTLHGLKLSAADSSRSVIEAASSL